MSDEQAYTLTVTKRQLATISRACEVLARLGMGQLDTVADEVPTTVWRKDAQRYSKLSKEEWDACWDKLRDWLNRNQHLATGLEHSSGFWSIDNREAVPESARIAWDIYTTARHQLYLDYDGEKYSGGVDAYPCSPVATVKPMTIEKQPR